MNRLCEETQDRLSDAALDQRTPDPIDREHAEACDACAQHRNFLHTLRSALDDVSRVPALPMRRVQDRATRVLRAAQSPAPFGKRLLRVVGLALLPLPFVIAYAIGIAKGASQLLDSILPQSALIWLGMIYFSTLAIGIGLVYAALPFAVAQRRSIERNSESP